MTVRIPTNLQPAGGRSSATWMRSPARAIAAPSCEAAVRKAIRARAAAPRIRAIDGHPQGEDYPYWSTPREGRGVGPRGSSRRDRLGLLGRMARPGDGSWRRDASRVLLDSTFPHRPHALDARSRATGSLALFADRRRDPGRPGGPSVRSAFGCPRRGDAQLPRVAGAAGGRVCRCATRRSWPAAGGCAARAARSAPGSRGRPHRRRRAHAIDAAVLTRNVPGLRADAGAHRDRTDDPARTSHGHR